MSNEGWKSFKHTVERHSTKCIADATGFDSQFVSLSFVAGMTQSINMSPDDARAIAGALLAAADYAQGITVRHIPFSDDEAA